MESPNNISSLVTRRPFGKTPDGQVVSLFTLTNSHGLTVSIMDYGATLVELSVPDRSGKFADVSLGFDHFEPYLTKSPYFGCTVGRFGNRIAKGRFSLNGKEFSLATNNGPHTLHGGQEGFDKKMWTADILTESEACVGFERLSPDGEEGYPGNLRVKVRFTLTEKNELKIEYEAVTDQITVVNLTNHTYFNLSGAGNGKILDHYLLLNASAYTPVDGTLIPTGKVEQVANTPMDFRQPTSIGSRIGLVGGDPIGYDHNYVVDRTEDGLELAAEVSDPASGRAMRVYTTEPAIQFYSGNFLDGTITGKAGKTYSQYFGFCLETQHFPDSPNQPSFPSTVLNPGDVYRSTTVYAFSH